MEYPQEKVKPYGQEGKKVEQVERMFETARGGARR